MRLINYRKISFALTLIATLSMLGSEAFARGGRGGRGGGGGGRAGGGRPAMSGGGRSMPSVGQRGNIGSTGSRPGTIGSGQHGAGKFGKQASNGAGLSSQAAGVKSKFANSSQLQGMLQQHSGKMTGQLSQHNGQLQQNLQTKAGQFQSGPQPFSPSWYAQHPNAWQATHPHAGAAAVASAAAVTAWVGAAYYPATGSGGSSTTVVYAPTIEEAAPVESTAAVSNPNTGAQQTAATQAPDSWLPIGTYAVSTTKGAPALLMIQLVVDRQGTLRGVYYDSVTDTAQNLVGKLDSNNQVAQWQLESNAQLSFRASLEALTQPTGSLQVNLPAGAQQWLLARVDSAQ